MEEILPEWKKRGFIVAVAEAIRNEKKRIPLPDQMPVRRPDQVLVQRVQRPSHDHCKVQSMPSGDQGEQRSAGSIRKRV